MVRNPHCGAGSKVWLSGRGLQVEIRPAMLQKKIAAIPHMVIRVMFDLMVIFLVGRRAAKSLLRQTFLQDLLRHRAASGSATSLPQRLRCALNLAMVFAALGALDLYLRRKKMTLKSIVQRQKKLPQFC